MKTVRRNGVLLLLLLVPVIALPASVAAQGLQFGLGGGASMPTGDLGTVAEFGWHAAGSLSLTHFMQPAGFRLEGAYHQFSAETGGHVNQASLTGNLMYRLPSAGWSLAPYVITGLGAYRTSCSPSCGSNTQFGWNAGLGARLYLLRMQSFLEARYQSSGSIHYFPVTLGIQF